MQGRGTSDRRGAIAAAVALAVAAAVGSAVVAAAAARPPGEDASAIGPPGGPGRIAAVAAPRAMWSTHAKREAESIPALLRRVGLSDREAAHLTDLVRPWADPDRLGRVRVRARHVPGGSPDRLELRLDADRTLRFALHGARWSVGLDSVAVTTDTTVVTGRVASSLYAAELAADGELSLPEKSELPLLLARVYEWQIDFYRDVRPGDAFRLALERDRRPDGSVRGLRLIAAEYLSRGRLLSAYRFRAAPDDEPAFYDRRATALRGAFLRSPLAYARVTSRFAPARYHPLLGRYRTHEGVDYGAPSGTPVRATGDGTVSEAGWWGEYGLMVELRHGRGLETRYAHLSGIADPIRPGARVEQGAVIGVVGSTGLSTAPHLHYEFRIHGRATDPTAVDLPLEHTLEGVARSLFASARARADALLATRPWPVAGPARAGRSSPDGVHVARERAAAPGRDAARPR